MHCDRPTEALILAAGRGERMRPLTDHTPKPLLEVAGKPLIEYHIEALAEAGIRDLVINLAHLGAQIPERLGDGARWGVRIRYSQEPPGALETGGGIFNALPMFEGDPILVLNGDLWTDFPPAAICCPRSSLAHLVLVPNPDHNRSGDFTLDDRRVGNAASPRHTFSGIGLYRRKLFALSTGGSFPLAPLLRNAADRGLVSGELYTGEWRDIGTPERLQELDQRVRRRER